MPAAATAARTVRCRAVAAFTLLPTNIDAGCCCYLPTICLADFTRHAHIKTIFSAIRKKGKLLQNKTENYILVSTYVGLLFQCFSFESFRTSLKLIGVQTNHGVEYFGGPAVPTHWFSYNQQFLHNQHVFWWLPQYRLHTDFSKEAYAGNLAKIASELSVIQPI